MADPLDGPVLDTADLRDLGRTRWGKMGLGLAATFLLVRATIDPGGASLAPIKKPTDDDE